MDMAYAPGRALLRRVAAEYRAHPESWSPKGFGMDRHGNALTQNPWRSTLRTVKLACIDTAMMRFAPAYGPFALWQARCLLYKQLGGSHVRDTIWHFNDAEGRTIVQVIECLEQASRIKVVTLGSLVGGFVRRVYGMVVRMPEMVPAFG